MSTRKVVLPYAGEIVLEVDPQTAVNPAMEVGRATVLPDATDGLSAEIAALVSLAIRDGRMDKELAEAIERERR